ncbi:hypothetical protein HDU77_003911 [Chytriomyces hyalinus]|nr:hypothetical protein HDU77_003911 [Chytriomyces hyalinus]
MAQLCAWNVLRLDSQSLGSSLSLAQVEGLVKSCVNQNSSTYKRCAVVVSSIRLPRSKSTVDRLFEAAYQCLQSPIGSKRMPTMDVGRSPCGQHIHLISALERDLVQLIRRSIKDAVLGEECEMFVGDALRRVRAFLSAIEIIGELSPTSCDSLMRTGDTIAAFIVAAFLQSKGIPAKLVKTDDVISSSFSSDSMDDSFFSHAVSRLSQLVENQVMSETDLVVPIFPGSFGTLPEHISLYTHTPNKTHSSLFAAILTLALKPFSPDSHPPNLHLLHTHISGIHTGDPRLLLSESKCCASRRLEFVDLSAAIELCGVGDHGGILSSTGLELVCGDSNPVSQKVYLAKIGDVIESLGASAAADGGKVLFESAVKNVGTRIGGGLEALNVSLESGVSSIVTYRKRIALLRIDRLIEGASSSAESGGGTTDFSDSSTNLIMESHRILGFVFGVLDECGVPVCLSSSSYRTVTIAVVDDLEPPSNMRIDIVRKSRSHSATPPGSPRTLKRAFIKTNSDPHPSPLKSNLQCAIEKLACLKATVNVYRNKGLISLIRTMDSARSPNTRTRASGEGTRHMLDALARDGIHFDMCAQGVGAVGVSVVVSEERVSDGVKAVHDACFTAPRNPIFLESEDEDDNEDEYKGSSDAEDDVQSEQSEQSEEQDLEESGQDEATEQQQPTNAKRKRRTARKPNPSKNTEETAPKKTKKRKKAEPAQPVDELDEDEGDTQSIEQVEDEDDGEDHDDENAGLTLKEDHSLRPIYASSNGRLFMETFSPIAEQAIDFLTAIAEPVSRPALMHEYLLTEYSLYAAVSVGIQADSIISVLGKLCKTDLPVRLMDFIRLHTRSYGKVKLVLKDNHQYVESAFPDVLRTLLKDSTIRDARIVVASEDQSADELNTRMQTFEPVNFARPVSAAVGKKGVKGVQEPSHAIAPAYVSSFSSNNNPSARKSSIEAQQLVQPTAKTLIQPAATENEFIDLFDDDNDPFDMDDDPFASLDPLELEKLNRILDGRAPTETEKETPALTSDESNETISAPTMDPMKPDNLHVFAPTMSAGEMDDESANTVQLPEDLIDLDIRGITDPSTSKSKSANQADATLLLSTFEIAREKSEHVRKACSTAGYPILEEYDFRNDSMLPTFDLVLKPAAILRPYQEKSLNKMFGNGRARSGIIVLPCGAGKTLVGVTAACTVKKRVLVLCTSAVSVEQWAREFKSWTNLKEGEVAKFTSQHKELLTNDNGVLISTYTMVTFSSKRAYDAQKMMDYICSREWGLLILDEVHVVPADMFKKVLTIVAAHCKLGLTATLVREDDKIANLNYLIGPKLYEANWMDLAKKGHIANVKCSEVWCTMTREFYKEYLDQSSRKRQLLYVMNPNKIQACQYLIDFHEQRGDKVIVFSDNVFALKHYATKLNRPYIYGGSSTADRLRTLQQFKYNPAVNTIFLSKVGDTSIDIPEASCLIQISSHYGSRRQEAQRLGRILRAKKNSTGNSATDGYNSFFYTLVSRDTEEVFYCSKRQQFLIDQGYSYDIITRMEGMETVAPLVYSTLNQRLELLATILVSNDMVDLREIEEDGDEDALALFGITREDALDGDGSSGTRRRRSGGVSSGGAVVQSMTSMKSLSGADNMAYIEQNRGGLGNEFRRKKK